jgi:hypothetical protein
VRVAIEKVFVHFRLRLAASKGAQLRVSQWKMQVNPQLSLSKDDLTLVCSAAATDICSQGQQAETSLPPFQQSTTSFRSLLAESMTRPTATCHPNQPTLLRGP